MVSGFVLGCCALFIAGYEFLVANFGVPGYKVLNCWASGFDFE